MAMAATLPAPMAPRAAFGVKGGLQDGLQFMEGRRFIYVASHCVIEKNLSDMKAPGRFIMGTSSMCGISAIAVSPDKRSVAVAEIGKLRGVSNTAAANPVINVYTAAKLVKKQSLTSAAVGSQEYVSLDFTCDGKHIAALGGPPEWRLLLWHIKKTYVVGSIMTVTLNSTGAYQVRCCPVDESWLSVCGDGFAKTYKMVDTDLRQVSTDYTNQEGRKVFCHTWILPLGKAEDVVDKDKGWKGKIGNAAKKSNDVVNCGCVYALDSGELLYVNNGEVIARLSMQKYGDEICVARTICPYSKGFICGENGKFSVYDYDRAHKTYKKVRFVKVDETNARVCGLVLSPAEDVLMCLLSTNRLIHLSLEEIDQMTADTISSNINTQSYHQASITGMDTCLLKPFVVTCSKDNSVRVWNYEESSCEILKFFSSEALSVSMHPNGLYLLVGFLDSLCMFNMLIDDLRLWREFTSVKGCTNCAFSRGGQCFAAASGNGVQIISTFTGQTIGHLRGHSNKVLSIWWTYDDCNIVTAGMDGAIYEWSLKTRKKIREHVIKSSPQTCAIGAKNSKCILSTSADCKLRELDGVEVFHTIETDVNLTQVVQFVEGALLFVGTEHGAVRAYCYPLTGVFHEIKVFAVAVVKVCLSSDNRLFCASEDGLMIMFDVPMPGPQYHTWSYEVLISKTDLEGYIGRVIELETKVVDTEKHCDHEIASNNQRLARIIKDMDIHYNGLLDEARDKHLELLKETNVVELNVERKQKETRAICAQHLQDMEEAYSKKIMVEISRYEEVVRNKEAASACRTQEMATMSKTHELALQNLMEEYEVKLEDTHEELKKSELSTEEITSGLQEVRKVVEEDVEFEIEEQREQFEHKLMIAEEAIRHVLSKNGILRHKFVLFQKDVDVSFTELGKLVNQKQELYEIVGGCQRDIQMLQRDLEQRDELLDMKEKRIYDLKRANLELEKFKWVLDFKLKELVQSIEPSQIEVAELKNRMENMEGELLSVRTNLNDKEILLRSLKAKLHAAGVETKRMLLATSRQADELKDFQADFHELSQKNESIRALKMGLMELYRKHVEGKVEVRNVDRSVEDEAFYRREMLERKVKTLEHELQKERKKNHQTQMRLVKDSKYLVGHTEELREEVLSRNQTPRMSSRPTTSDEKDQISLVRKQIAELQLQVAARCVCTELLKEGIEAQSAGHGLRHGMGVKNRP